MLICDVKVHRCLSSRTFCFRERCPLGPRYVHWLALIHMVNGRTLLSKLIVKEVSPFWIQVGSKLAAEDIKPSQTDSNLFPNILTLKNELISNMSVRGVFLLNSRPVCGNTLQRRVRSHASCCWDCTLALWCIWFLLWERRRPTSPTDITKSLLAG